VVSNARPGYLKREYREENLEGINRNCLWKEAGRKLRSWGLQAINVLCSPVDRGLSEKRQVYGCPSSIPRSPQGCCSMGRVCWLTLLAPALSQQAKRTHSDKWHILESAGHLLRSCLIFHIKTQK
jgi:hypothetical protein